MCVRGGGGREHTLLARHEARGYGGGGQPHCVSPRVSFNRRPTMSQTPPAPGLYRHYKGKEYEVLGTATHSETGERLVVYRPCYGERALWVRPLDMFVEEVEVSGVRRPRFARVGDAAQS